MRERPEMPCQVEDDLIDWYLWAMRDRKWLQDLIKEMRRDLDNIKIRSYELGQKELHNMALDALVKHDAD